MLFTNIRSYSKPQETPTSSYFMTFTPRKNNMLYFHNQNHVPTNVSVVKAKPYTEELSKVKPEKKIKWGEPFWNLFHVMAEKIKESEFPRLRQEILNLIFSICSNLPCPECTKHAVAYLNGLNFNTIQTKDQLKMMLYTFHNDVNARKHYPLFPLESMDKYKYGNLRPIIDTFFKHFVVKHTNFSLLADNMQRKKVTSNVVNWFNENNGAFAA